jgi:large conductance mechanosensitive channel
MNLRSSELQLKQAASWGATHATSFFEEFRQFALKGNVVDLAIGVIIGAAFGKIVDSLVKNIIMPAISLLVPSNESYLGWKLTIDGKDIPYGLFLGEVVNFLIVALALFLFAVKFLGWVARRRSAAQAADAAAAAQAVSPLTKDQELLGEIRDLLKERTASHGPA